MRSRGKVQPICGGRGEYNQWAAAHPLFQKGAEGQHSVIYWLHPTSPNEFKVHVLTHPHLHRGYTVGQDQIYHSSHLIIAHVTLAHST